MELSRENDTELFYRTKEQQENAYQAVKETLAKFPEEGQLYMYAGDICRKLKKYEEAFPYWEKANALNQDTGFLDSRYSMAFCYEELGEYEKACSIWDEIAAISLEW